MKRLITILTLLLTLNLNASHIMGGMVSVAQMSQDSTSVGVFLITDPQGITPNTIYVEQWEMDSSGIYTQNGTIQAIKDTTIFHQGMNVNTYLSNYLNLDSTKKYRFIYKNCCWGMLNNSTNSFSSDFIISADYWHIPNNSLPYSINPLWINMQNNTLNTMKPIWGITNCFLSQLDNDSVNITQSALYSGYASGTFVPQVHTPLNMSVSNDSVSWTPTMLGNYGTGFEITEYRNGQLIGVQRIQWTFRVVNSIVGIKELNIEYHTKYKVYNWSGEYLGNTLENQKGFLIVIYSDGEVRKLFKRY
jgi:hypothetical protein